MTYKEIFSPAKGNIFQRLIKFWIIPRFPRLSIIFYTIIGVPILRWLIMNTIGRLRTGNQTNYHVGQGTLDNLLTYATNQTMYNEAVHFIMAIVIILLGCFAGPLSSINIFLLALNLYLCFIQRYNRARIILTIEWCVNKGARPKPTYDNWLGLDFGQSTNRQINRYRP